MGQNHNLNTLEAMRKKVQQMGTKGATILVTTRLEQVASIMETHPAYRLIKLSQDYSWSLFKHHAFGPNREEREEIVAIGKEIVRKCVGSPLAIKTLGSLLCDEIEVTQWQNIKGSEFWNIREESSITGEETSIMRALKLSYFNLELSLGKIFFFLCNFSQRF